MGQNGSKESFDPVKAFEEKLRGVTDEFVNQPLTDITKRKLHRRVSNLLKRFLGSKVAQEFEIFLDEESKPGFLVPVIRRRGSSHTYKDTVQHPIDDSEV